MMLDAPHKAQSSVSTLTSHVRYENETSRQTRKEHQRIMSSTTMKTMIIMAMLLQLQLLLHFTPVHGFASYSHSHQHHQLPPVPKLISKRMHLATKTSSYLNRPSDKLFVSPACIRIQQQQQQPLNKLKRTNGIMGPKSSSSLSMSLIAREDTWGNIAALTTISSISQTYAPRTKVGRLLGPPVTAMAIAFLLGSIKILPSGGSPAAKIIQSLSLQLATPLLLLSADLKEAKDSCGPLLQAFLYASLGTLLASTLAMITPIGSMVHRIGLQNDGVKIAAALMAKNIGGGLNYIAVCQTLQASPNSVAAGLCVDNVYALLYFPITSALAKGRPDVKSSSTTSPDSSLPKDSPGNISVADISTALGLASISTWFGEKIGGPFSASLPVSTLFTILLTTILPKSITKSKSTSDKGETSLFAIPASMTLQNLRPAGEVLGTSLLYLFFATAGAPGLAIADSVRASFLPLSLFLLCLYSVHGAFLLLVKYLYSSWFRRNGRDKNLEDPEDGVVAPQRLLVASSAAIGGPATAAALAQANDWNSLVGPSLLVGNLGYAIATFMGIAFYGVFKK